MSNYNAIHDPADDQMDVSEPSENTGELRSQSSPQTQLWRCSLISSSCVDEQTAISTNLEACVKPANVGGIYAFLAQNNIQLTYLHTLLRAQLP